MAEEEEEEIVIPTALPARYKDFLLMDENDAVFQSWIEDRDSCSCSEETAQLLSNLNL